MSRAGVFGPFMLVLSLPALLAGCAGTMSGLDGQGKFSCKAPDGIACASLAGVYANALQNNLPGQERPPEAATTPKVASPGHTPPSAITRPVPSSGEPIRSAQTVRRIWLAPWEDDEEVLHDQSYVYFVVDPGRWQLAHTRRNASEAYRPVMPPTAFTPAVTNPDERPALRMEREASGSASPPSLPLRGRELLQPPSASEGNE
ncbi:type IV conjugative transfer system lipoprotein TraV [Accumulibacter sp.]|uniref:type IV conjugative transfer system lipoprotein TraV n=1 Tax=Accumulibacter sp. TaxID=2053492 RepID=UPI00260F9E29|nr:type IV conjugative transfer system lipoprotein TraV [Accumulibacter sp.]